MNFTFTFMSPTPSPVRFRSGSPGICLFSLLLALVMVVGLPALLRAQAPANDVFAGRQLITGSTNTLAAGNENATAEPGEPSHAGNPPGASVWWTWIAPDTGPARIDTAGSSFDTVLAVYTGSSLGALSLVAANDDAPHVATSAVAFSALRGTAYHIAVDGFESAQGAVRLNVGLAASPSAPTIRRQPAGSTTFDGHSTNLTFSVDATGSFPLAFQWLKDGVPLDSGTGDSYSILRPRIADAGAYRVVVSNAYGSITSSIATLEVLIPSDNDDFTRASVLTGQAVRVSANNFLATREPGEPLPGGIPSGGSVWWSWTAPSNGLVRLDTTGSVTGSGAPLDTVLGVYTGASLGSLMSVAANNDAMADQVRTSGLSFRAKAGVVYRFVVAGLVGGGGSPALGVVNLNLFQSPDNDWFVNALPFPADATQVRDNNVGATIEPGEPKHSGQTGGHSIWWTWVPSADGTFALDSVGSSFDTVLAIYTGSDVGALTLVGEDGDRGVAGPSQVKFFATAGTPYHFLVDGATGTNGVASGDVVLNLKPSQDSNDDFVGRFHLTGQTNQVAGSTLAAGKEVGEPNHGGNAGGKSLWWTWTARVTSPVLVTTRGSSFDTVLAVYTGSSLSTLKLVGQNDDADPADPTAGAEVFFNAVAGRTYQIAVDGYRAVQGTVAAGAFVLTLSQPSPLVAGANDGFVQRFTLEGTDDAAVGLSTLATVEPGEPNHAGNDGGKSLWWTWVAPASTAVTIHTVGSSFETLLAVYTGADVRSLQKVAADIRSAGGGRSVVTFNAMAGTRYQIAVDGFNSGDGAQSGEVAVTLHQHPPGALKANDDFANATPVVDPFLTVHGSNIGATRQAGEPAHYATQVGHSVWWSWQASASAPVTISTTGSQFDTLLSVYSGPTLSTLALVAEDDDPSPGTLQASVTFEAKAGTVYRIAVDGYDNQIGNVVLTVSPAPVALSAPRITQNPKDKTRFIGGAGGGSTFTFTSLAIGTSPLSYQWQRNGTNIPGGTANTYTLTNSTSSDAGLYHVVVSNAVGSVTTLPVVFTWIDMPFNDHFSDRILIPPGARSVRSSILGASKEPGEPNHGGEVGGRSVWWKWLAPSDGPVEIHTVGSPFDTLLAVYTGDAPDRLTLVAENNDMVLDQIYSSRVVFNAIAGTEYQIAVDGAKTDGTASSVLLTLNQPPSQPALAPVPDQAATQNVGINLFVDVTSPLRPVSDLTFTATAADSSLVPSVVATNTGTNVLVGLTFGRDLIGTTSVTLTVTDGVSTVSRSFGVTVHPELRLRTMANQDGSITLRLSLKTPVALRLESSTDLTVGSWQPAQGPVLTSPSDIEYEWQIPANALGGSGYFRVVSGK